MLAGQTHHALTLRVLSVVAVRVIFRVHGQHQVFDIFVRRRDRVDSLKPRNRRRKHMRRLGEVDAT